MKNLLLSFIASLFLFSCQIEEAKSNSSTSELINNNFTFRLSEYSNTTVFTTENLNLYPRPESFNVLYTEANSEKFDEILKNFQINEENLISSLVIYQEDNSSKTPYISVFFYSKNEQLIKHKLFVYDVNRYISDEKWNFKTSNAIIPGYLELFAKIVDKKLNKATLIFNKDASNKLELKDIDKNEFNDYIINNSTIGYRGSGCTLNVCKLEIETHNCGVHPEGGLDCGVPGSGDEDCAKDELEDADTDQEQTIKAKTALAYKIKDFLNTFDKGKDYVNYYYFVSKILSSNNTIYDEPAKFFNAFIKCISIGEKLLNNSNEILISNEDYNFFIELIDNTLTNQSNNTEYINILQIVKQDLNNFKNKSANEVKSELNI